MKLKQTLLLGLTAAVLAVPAFAAEEAMNATSLSAPVHADQKEVTLSKKEIHKKGREHYAHKEGSLEAKKMDKQAIDME